MIVATRSATMSKKNRSSGTLKMLWKAYHERNKRYESLTELERQRIAEENKQTAEHNAKVSQRYQK
jgi:hypothetical protein